MPCWFPVAFRPPAFASWASCSRQGTGPPSRSAYRHAPAHRRSTPDPDGVSTFHTRKTRLGLGALCIPGTTVSTRSSMCPRPPPAASQRQRPCPPSTTTRPGRFESRDISLFLNLFWGFGIGCLVEVLGFADRWMGCDVLVAGAGWAAWSWPGGFRRAGGNGQFRAQVAKPAPYTGGGQAARVGSRSFALAAKVVGVIPAQKQ